MATKKMVATVGKMITFAGTLIAACGMAYGGVTVSGVVTETVATGQTQGFSGATIAGDGALLKKGGGTLTLTTQDAYRPGKLSVEVAEGAVTFSGADTPALPTLSDSVTNKIVLWLSAANIDTEGEVTRWYDVRETNTDSPTYPYAEADTKFSDAKPTYSAASQCIVGDVTNTLKAVYFGGYGSGKRMALFWPNGKSFGDADATTSYPSTAFVVFGRNHAKKLGVLFGTMNTTEIPLFADGTSPLGSYFYSAVWGPLAGIICRLDGNRIDARSEEVASGVHLLEMTPNPYSSSDWSLPYCLMGRGNAKYMNGGELMSELIWFHKSLTEDERLEVERYLTIKWLGRGGARTVALASDTTLTVDAGASGDETRTPFAARGAGTVRKTGAGAIVVGTEVNDIADAAPIAIAEGSVIAKRSAPTLKPVAGTRYATADETVGTRITPTADAGSGKIVKEGVGAVRLSGLDADVTELNVEQGTLAIAPPTSSTFDADHTEITIPGSGFETNDLQSASYYGRGAFAGGDWGYKSWIAGNTAGSGVVFWYDYDKWTALGDTTPYGSIGASIKAWSFHTCRPPEGTCAMAIKQWGWLRSRDPFAITNPGTYELSLMLWGRSTGSRNFGLQVSLLDSSNNVVTNFGVVRYYETAGFRKKIVTAQIAKAGNYKLKFAGFYNYATSCPDVTVVLDDIHLYRVGPLKPDWQIPNGDFEFAKIPTCSGTNGSKYNVFSYSNTVDGWTFEAPEGCLEAKTPVGVTTPLMGLLQGRRGYNVFDNSRAPRGGDIGLLFQTNATITTTFTPPAGTRYLTACVAHWGINDVYSVPLSAMAKIGNGEPISLGRVYATTHELKRAVWPVPLTTDGSTEVTISVTCENGGKSNTGAMVDDFALTTEYAEDRELLTDGGFEKSNRDGTGTWTLKGGTPRTYLEDTKNFGFDFAGGEKYMDFYGAVCCSRSIAFPKAGTYRVSLLARNRKAGWTPQGLHVELVWGATTNRILTVPPPPNRYTRYEALFKVAAAGEATFQLRGLIPYGCILVDDVSVKYVMERPPAATTLNPALGIVVKSGAALTLDFDGVQTVDRVRLGGKAAFGRIDATTHPDYISGTGALYAERKGMLLLYK